MQGPVRHSRRRQPPILVFAVLACAWVVLTAIWLLLVDTFTLPEIVAGAVAAVVGAYAARLALASPGSRDGTAARRRSRSSAWSTLTLATVRQMGRVPADLWLLTRELVRALRGRHTPGRFAAVALPGGGGGGGGDGRGQGDGSDSARSRAAPIELIGSLAPNTIVLGVNDHEAIVHQLVQRAAQRHGLEELAQ